jgi:hypothetical protein
MSNIFEEYERNGPTYECSRRDDCGFTTRWDDSRRCPECGEGWMNERAEITMNAVEWVRSSNTWSNEITMTAKSGKKFNLRLKLKRDGRPIEAASGRLLAQGRPFRSSMLVQSWLDPANELPREAE